MQKFSEILKNKTDKDSFLLGMIYSWIMIDKKRQVILAYSSYKIGKRIKKIINADIFKYHLKFIAILKKFIGEKFDIQLNKEIRKKYIFEKILASSGVSVLLALDIEIDFINDNYILGLIEKAMIGVENNKEKKFILGLMTGRSSIDFTARYITIDLEKKDYPEIAKRKLLFIYKIMSMRYINFNPRLLQPKSSQKNDQFRIPLDYFLSEYGLLNPLRIDSYCAEEKVKNNKLIPFKVSKNLKHNISKNFGRRLEVNELAVQLKRENLSEEEKQKLISKQRDENYGTYSDNEEVLYANPNIKAMAKELNDYKCEIDGNVGSFMSGSNNKNYVEGHHLIPFSKRHEFDVNIDVLENIVCLNAKNHRKIHLGLDFEKEELLKKLFKKRKESLKKVGINIDFTTLKKLYSIK